MKEQPQEAKYLATESRGYFKRRYHDVWEEIENVHKKMDTLGEKLTLLRSELEQLEKLTGAAEKFVQESFPEVIAEEERKLRAVQQETTA